MSVAEFNRLFTRDEEEIYEKGFPQPDPPSRDDGLPPGEGASIFPHYLSFARTVNLLSRTYRWQFDEALRHNRQNALAIRRDPVVMDALRSRQIPTAQLEWHLEGPEDQNPKQDEAITGLTRIISEIPRFQQLKMHLLEAMWYGRYAVQLTYEWKWEKGRKLLTIRDHKPINGDKLVFKFSGQSGVLVHATFPGESMITDRGRAHFFTPVEREQLLIHHYEPEDADFYEGELAGQIAGVGIRSRIYWLWWLRNQVMSWMMDYLERVGAGGFTIYFYEAGNAQSKTEVREAAESQHRNNVILFPRYKDMTRANGGPGIQRIEPGLGGVALIQALVTDYFDAIIRRYILGQTLTSQAGSTGLGSGVAGLHEDTFSRLVKYDAVSLEETLTQDLVHVLQKYNYPDSPPLRFRFDIDQPNAKEILESASLLFGMGAALDEDQLMEIAGLSKPEPGHSILAKMGSMSPAGMGGQIPQGIPFAGPPGPIPPMGVPGAGPAPIPGGPPMGPPPPGATPFAREDEDPIRMGKPKTIGLNDYDEGPGRTYHPSYALAPWNSVDALHQILNLDPAQLDDEGRQAQQLAYRALMGDTDALQILKDLWIDRPIQPHDNKGQWYPPTEESWKKLSEHLTPEAFDDLYDSFRLDRNAAMEYPLTPIAKQIQNYEDRRRELLTAEEPDEPVKESRRSPSLNPRAEPAYPSHASPRLNHLLKKTKGRVGGGV